MAAEPTTQPAAAAGTVRLGDLTRQPDGLRRDASDRQRRMGDPADREGAKAVLRRAVELGVTLIDTAASYGPEVNEELIAETLHPYPEGLVVATKGGLTRPGPGSGSGTAGRRRSASRSRAASAGCGSSGSTSTSCMRSIPRCRSRTRSARWPSSSGRGRSARRAVERRRPAAGHGARDRPDRLGAEPLQPRRPPLRGRARRLRAGGARVPPWFPLALGRLAAATGRLAEVARSHGATPAQVALAWLLRRSPVMAPIPGTSSVEHLEENMAAAELELTDAEFAGLSRTAESAL